MLKHSCLFYIEFLLVISRRSLNNWSFICRVFGCSRYIAYNLKTIIMFFPFPFLYLLRFSFFFFFWSLHETLRKTRVQPLGWRREKLPVQYSGLENSVYCVVHGVAKSWTQLSVFHFTSLPCDMWNFPWPRIKPVSPELGTQSLNHWTTKEVLLFLFLLLW